MGKRKRELSAKLSPGAATASVGSEAGPSSATLAETASPRSDRKGKGKEVESRDQKEGPKISYATAEGSNRFKKRLDLKRDHAKSLRHIAKKLGIPKEQSGNLRLAHVREGGREVEIWDDIDYEAFKTRAIASPGSSLSIKIYGLDEISDGQHKERGGVSQADAAAATSTIASSSNPPVMITPHSLSKQETACSSDTPAKSTLKRKDTRRKVANSTLPPGSSTGSPSPILGESPSTASKDAKITKDKRGKKRKSLDATSTIATTSTSPTIIAVSALSPPSTPSPPSAPSTPSPMLAKPALAMRFENKYRPARPSPLGPNRVVPPPTPSPASPLVPSAPVADSAETPASSNQAEKRRRKRQNRRKARQSGIAEDSTGESAPESTSSKVNVHTVRMAEVLAVEDGARELSPPKKRARQMQGEADAIHPAVDLQSQHLPSTASTASSSMGGLAESASTAAPHAIPVASKKVARISVEEYDLKQKPKETKRDSSSITGEKKGKSKATKTADLTALSSGINGDLSMEDASMSTSSAVTPAEAFTPTAEPSLTRSTGPMEPTPATPAPSKKSRRGSKAQKASGTAVPSPLDSNTRTSPAVPLVANEAATAERQAVQPLTTVASPASLPTTPGSSKKGKARAKKAETPKPAKLTLVQEILQRQRERLAAEAAAKAAPEEANSAEETVSEVPSPQISGANSISDEQEDAEPVSATANHEIGSDVEMGELTAGADALTPIQGTEDTVMDVTKDPAVPAASSVDEQPTVLAAAETKGDTLVPETAQLVGHSIEDPAPDVDIAEPATNANDSSIVPDTLTSEPPYIAPAHAVSTSGKKGPASKSGKSKLEVPCDICLRTPWHYQKDCPEVKAGAENLKYLLAARQEQHDSIAEGDGDSHFAQSVETIQEWIERLDKIAGKVQGVSDAEMSNGALRPRSPIGIMGIEDISTEDLNIRSPSKQPVGEREKAVARQPETSVETQASSTSDPASSPESADVALREAATSGSTSLPSPAQGPSPTATATATAVATPPESPAAVPDTFNFPPIHLKALQKSRRTGSTSGLSVSDAYIETEPSDDSSSDEDEDEQGSERGDNEDDDAESGSESNASTTSSAVSSDSDDSFESATSSRVAMPTNPSEAISFSLTRELSEREKKKARLSAAKMQPVSFDVVSATEDEELDDEQADRKSPSPPPAARLSRARADSDSSIGDYGDDASRRSSVSDNDSPVRHHAPPVIASSSVAPNGRANHFDAVSDQNDEDGDVSMEDNLATPSLADPICDAGTDDEAPTSVADPITDSIDSTATKSSRSFREIDGIAASSPEMDDAGLKAVQQGIAEEEDGSTVLGAEEDAKSEVASSAPAPVPTQSLSQARRTRRQSSLAGSQASQTPVDIAPVPSSSGLRRSSRNSVQPPDVPAPVVATRLRSVSREVQEKTPPPSRSTRSASRSRASMSPSLRLQSPATPRTRRVSATLSNNGQEDATPKQNSTRQTRQTRSSQVNPPDSSLPIIEEAESSQSQSYPAAIDAQTQSTPVRRSTRASPSPLFMTQGSQIPATQFYNPLPEIIPEEASSPPTSAQRPTPKRGRNAKLVNGERGTSPIAEEETTTDSEAEEDVNKTPRAEIAPPPSQFPPSLSLGANGDAAIDDLDSVEDGGGEVEMNGNDHDNDNDNDNDNESQASDAEAEADDEEDDIPDIPLPSLRRPPASQPAPSGTQYTGLSSLPLDLLRSAKTYMFSTGNKKGDPSTPSGPMRNGNGQKTRGMPLGESDDDSGESSDSSAGEVEPPSAIKGRFVSGGMKKKAASQPMSW